MTAKIIPFTGITKLDLPADRVLSQAIGNLEGVIVIGFDQAGDFYAASSYADGGTALWLLEQCKRRILEA